MFVLRNALYLQNQPFLQRRTGPFVNAVALSDLLLSFLGFSFEVRLLPRRLQNSPYFCVFKYARAVQQKVWNEAENREQDWGETLKIRTVRFAYVIFVRITRFSQPRAIPIG